MTDDRKLKTDSEGGAQRRHTNKFKNRLNDAEGSATETQTWLDFASDCGYIKTDIHTDMAARSDRIAAMLYRFAANWTSSGPARSILGRRSPVLTPLR